MTIQRYTCAWCGEDMGVFDRRYHSRDDTCGKAECVRGMRDMAEQEREEAHRQLDRDLGYDEKF